MPTETEPTLPPSPPPIDVRSRSSTRASCPPDEIRDAHAPREDRIEDVEDAADGPTERVAEERTIMQQPTPEPDTEPNAASAEGSNARKPDGRESELAEDGAMAIEPPSPVASPSGGGDSDARLLTHTMSGAAISPQAPAPLYLSFGEDHERMNLQHSTSSFLRPGSKFKGTQQSDRQVYDVQVDLKDVNMAESFLCGYLRIQGLTDDHPTLTTFFEGEIIGPKHLFRTTHPSWGSNEKTDLQHWARFPAWRPLAKSAKAPNFTLKNPFAREHIFMRWKESFLVPDHRVKTITGASFEGFYYICFDQREGKVSGIYFHAKSEKYQQLELSHVEDHGCMGAVEFR